nr:4'-phosphopantetheinyl transferase superfamily protein [Candidatus Atelocyanobacterium thalassa]
MGVDIEYIRPLLGMEKIAKRFFCFQEFSKLKSFNSYDKNIEFLRLWTGKEAYLKATGEGISQRLNTVKIITDYPMQIIDVSPLNYLPWRILSFITQSNYLISIVTLEKKQKIYYWKI